MKRRFRWRWPEGPEKTLLDLGTGVTATIEICVSERGGVESLAIAHYSQLVRWNRHLFEWFRASRYRPLRVDGAPIRMCARISLISSIWSNI